MKEDNDEVTTKTRIFSLELLQVSSQLHIFFGFDFIMNEVRLSVRDEFYRDFWRVLVTHSPTISILLTL